MMEQDDTRDEQDTPFDRVRARSFLGWALLALVGSGIVVLAADVAWGAAADETLMEALAMWMIYIVVGGWVLSRRRHGVDLRRFFPRVEMPPLRTLLALTLVVLLFSIGAVWVVYVPLSYVAPGLVQAWVLDAPALLNLDDPGAVAVAANIAIAVVVVVVAPVVEETLFRGVLLARWTRKWGVRPAMIVSALFFSAYHPDILGAFVFALVMTLLYLRTRTLLAPVAVHAFNNLAALLLYGFASLRPDWVVNVETVADLRRTVGIGLGVFIVPAGILLVMLVRGWPGRGTAVPYGADPAAGVSRRSPGSA